MSTCAVFEDELEFDEAIASVRADTKDIVYVIVGHVGGDPMRIEVVRTGQNVDEIVDHLEDEQVCKIFSKYGNVNPFPNNKF